MLLVVVDTIIYIIYDHTNYLIRMIEFFNIFTLSFFFLG